MAIDFEILDFIQAHLRCGFLDVLMPLVTRLCDGGVFWIVCAVALLAFRKTRRLGAAMAAALALEFILCDLVIKPLAARPRPFVLRPDFALLIKPPSGFSFPSGHTGASFAAASALAFSRSKLAPAAAVLAAVIAFSRLYLYVHFPTDVLAGAALGLLCGLAAAKLANIKRREDPTK